jgi:hypothetical protein
MSCNCPPYKHIVGGPLNVSNKDFVESMDSTMQILEFLSAEEQVEFLRAILSDAVHRIEKPGDYIPEGETPLGYTVIRDGEKIDIDYGE